MSHTTKNNQVRIIFLDLARGFTALFIPLIHALLMFGNQQTANHLLTVPFIFIAEWPGAQLFLLLLGINIMLKRKLRAITILLRSLTLFAIGYTLNILKFYIPVQLQLMPVSFVMEVMPPGYSEILIGDILHLAALSLPVALVIRKSNHPLIISVLFIIVMLFVSQHQPVLNSSSPFDQHTTLLLFGQPPHTYFPFFPWFTYVLFGIIVGSWIKTKGITSMWQLVPVGVFILGFTKLLITNSHAEVFYKPQSLNIIMHAGFLLLWIGSWSILSPYLTQTKAASLLVWSSKNLTFSYFVQWPLICFLIPVLGYKTLGIATALIVATLCTIATFLLTQFLNTQLKKYDL